MSVRHLYQCEQELRGPDPQGKNNVSAHWFKYHPLFSSRFLKNPHLIPVLLITTVHQVNTEEYILRKKKLHLNVLTKLPPSQQITYGNRPCSHRRENERLNHLKVTLHYASCQGAIGSIAVRR